VGTRRSGASTTCPVRDGKEKSLSVGFTLMVEMRKYRGNAQ